MQTSTQSQATPAPVAAPAPAATPAPPATFVYVGADGKSQAIPIPQTREEVRAIQAQRDQISNQLESVADRRAGLARQLAATTSDVAKPGIEARIQLLDRRILQLETDLATTGQQLSLASGELVESTQVPRGDPDAFEEGLMVGGLLVFGFMAVVYVVTRWRRKRRGGKRPKTELGDDATSRLERLENGMDAIAIEIERVSEGQRFVTKLLSETQSQRLPQPVAAQSSDPTR